MHIWSSRFKYLIEIHIWTVGPNSKGNLYMNCNNVKYNIYERDATTFIESVTVEEPYKCVSCRK